MKHVVRCTNQVHLPSNRHELELIRPVFCMVATIKPDHMKDVMKNSKNKVSIDFSIEIKKVTLILFKIK